MEVCFKRNGSEHNTSDVMELKSSLHDYLGAYIVDG